MRKNLKTYKSLLGTWYHGNWSKETYLMLGGAELGPAWDRGFTRADGRSVCDYSFPKCHDKTGSFKTNRFCTAKETVDRGKDNLNNERKYLQIQWLKNGYYLKYITHT